MLRVGMTASPLSSHTIERCFLRPLCKDFRRPPVIYLECTTIAAFGRERRIRARVHAALEGYNDEEVFAEVKVQRGQSAQTQKSIKQAEMETLIASKDELGDDKPDGDFFARNLPRNTWDAPWMKNIERVVLVHHLREVMAQVGFTRFEQIATVLELIENDRKSGRASEPPIDLVTSGPEAPGITNRDTSVVVRELFAHAKKSVLVVGYAVYQGQRVFESLAKRMLEAADLDVQFFLNISRPDGDETAPEILVARFKQRFQDSQWPAGCRVPEVYYDPRSIAHDKPVRSSLHAKCVVVDAEHVFVSSANFTEAGQERNIEVGLNIESKWLAERLIRHFKLLQERKLVVRAF